MPQVKSISTNHGSKPDPQVESAADFGKEQASHCEPNRPSSRVPLAKTIRQRVSQLASDFRREHGLQECRLGDRIARLFRSGITPRRTVGRPATPEVLKAVALRRKNTPWPRVFPQVIADYWDLPYEEQYCLRDKLRRAVGAYFRRRRTKRSNRKREKDLSSVRPRSDAA